MGTKPVTTDRTATSLTALSRGLRRRGGGPDAKRPGVSVAGFLAIGKQVGGVAVKLDRLAETVERRFDEQRRHALRDLEGDPEAQLGHAEEGWTGDGTARWARFGNRLNDMAHRYPAPIEEELQAPAPDLAVLAYALERYRILAAKRIECLVLIGELFPDKCFAARFAEKSNAHLNDVAPATLARQIARGQAAAGQGEPGEPAGSRLERTCHLVAAAREIRDLSVTRPLLLARLIESRIDGRDYLPSLRENRASPIVFLK